MSYEKILAGLALAAAVVGAGAAPALAGEVTGRKDGQHFTPINVEESDSDATPMRSFCAFSGLEDEGPNAGPGNVQTPKGDANGATYEPGSAQACSFFNHGRFPGPWPIPE